MQGIWYRRGLATGLEHVFWSLTGLPYESLNLAVDKHLNWNMCFFIGSCFGCTFSFVPDVMAKIQNLLIHDHRFEEFMIPPLDDFVDGDRMNCCCGPLELSGNNCSGRSSTALGFLVCWSQ